MGRLVEEAASGVVAMTVEVTLLGAAATVADTEVEAEGTHPIKIARGCTPHWNSVRDAVWQRRF